MTEDKYHTMDELYEHRIALFIALMRCNKENSWKSKYHNDGTFYAEWFIAGIHLSSGDITYHLPTYKWAVISDIKELSYAPEWDGHTSNNVIDRLLAAKFEKNSLDTEG